MGEFLPAKGLIEKRTPGSMRRFFWLRLRPFGKSRIVTNAAGMTGGNALVIDRKR
jgi:hypothetical protein